MLSDKDRVEAVAVARSTEDNEEATFTVELVKKEIVPTAILMASKVSPNQTSPNTPNIQTAENGSANSQASSSKFQAYHKDNGCKYYYIFYYLLFEQFIYLIYLY
jgi:predicted ATP-dependent protease